VLVRGGTCKKRRYTFINRRADFCLCLQVRAERSQRKLQQQVRVLEIRIADIDAAITRQVAKLRQAHKDNPLDKTSKITMFEKLRLLRKTAACHKRLNNACTKTLDHVDEQAVMNETTQMLQEFVDVHGTIKEVNLEKIVSQFQQMSSDMNESQADLGYINEALSGGVEDDEQDLEAELEQFLNEEIPAENVALLANLSVPAYAEGLPSMAPSTQTIESITLPAVPVVKVAVRQVTDYFPIASVT